MLCVLAVVPEPIGIEAVALEPRLEEVKVLVMNVVGIFHELIMENVSVVIG